MSRLIDADALMADCQLAQKQADRHGREFANAFYSGGGEISTEWWCVEDMIENAPTIEERKWIPWDSGRLPDDSGMYIVTAYDGVQERVTFAKYQKRMKRWELTGARAYWRVLAWMPLPESYSGETKLRDYENKGDDD